MTSGLLAITIGSLAGLVYFAGLWLTVRLVVSRRRGAGLAMISWLLRMTLFAAVFYALSSRGAALAIAGFGGLWLTRSYLLFHLRGREDAR